MTSNPFQIELQRRQAAKSAHRTNEQRIAALGMVLLKADGRGKLEQIRKLHPALVRDLEAMHEATLKAKARAWDERQQMSRPPDKSITAAPIESETANSPLATNLATDQPNYTRASDRQILRERPNAAVHRLPDQPVKDVQSLTRDVRSYEVSPSLDKSPNRMSRGSELARRLRKLWHPPTLGDGGWMNNR